MERKKQVRQCKTHAYNMTSYWEDGYAQCTIGWAKRQKGIVEECVEKKPENIFTYQ